jgi:4-amino-4-deoxy-L-arabinose transferase-like glycosyltransferase
MTVRQESEQTPPFQRFRKALLEPAPLSIHKQRFPHVVVAGPIVALAALAQWAMLRQPLPSDAMAYFQWAESIRSNPISHGPTRLGVTVPVRLAIEIFGPSELAFHIVPVTMFLILVLGLYLLGTQLFSQSVGALAAVLFGSSPLVFEYSSHPLPDPFAVAWFVAALVVLLSCTNTPATRKRDLRVVLGALLVGLAYLCREYVILLAPVLLVIAWRQRWRRREIYLALTAFTAILLLEGIAMTVLFGDPFARVRAVTGFGGTESAAEVLAAYGANATRWTVLSRGPNSFRAYDLGTMVLWSTVAVPLLCVFARFTDRPAWRFVATWLISLWLPMVLLAGLWDPSSPRIRDYHVRYWFLIVPAMFLATAALLRQLSLWAGPRLRWMVSGLLIIVLATGTIGDLRSIPDTMRFRAFGGDHSDEIRTWFATSGQNVDEIWTDSRSARVLRLYTVNYLGAPIWQGEIRVFDDEDGFVPVEQIDGAIIAYELGLRYLSRNDLKLPEEYRELPSEWMVDVRRADGTLWIARRRESSTHSTTWFPALTPTHHLAVRPEAVNVNDWDVLAH